MTAASVLAALLTVVAVQDGRRIALEPGPAPADNPLKGLVPYAGDYGDAFPYSLEFSYLPLSKLVVGEGNYDWKPLEKLLDDIAGRGHQAVFRVFLEYPGRETGIPKHLLDGGLEVRRWKDPHARSRRHPENLTPDYEDESLRRTLRDFIAAMGKRYDGDPRLGFLTAGLLGLWGEWHDYPKSELFASKAVQAEVMDAYERAFRTTPVLHRYPAGEGDGEYAANDRRALGYHDDSFAWATLETGREDDSWFYMALLRKAGPAALEKWKTHPIGGEIRPEAWGRVFDEDPGKKQIQDFRTCVETTHATWLMDSGMFRKKQPDGRVDRALEEVRRMGYVFHAPAATIGPVADGKLSIKVEVVNRGVAPFYCDWPAEVTLRRADGTYSERVRVRGTLKGLLPGAPAREWSATVDLAGLEPGRWTVLLRVPNPLPKGPPVRFANASQDADVAGFVTLGPADLPE